MARASRPCRIPGCPHLKPCPIEGHERKPWEGSNRRAELPTNWTSSIAPAVLARDPTCTICHAASSTDVHHIGNKHDHRLEQLAGVCSSCHRAETQAQAAAARRANH